jgi:putative DNA primase/helicase
VVQRPQIGRICCSFLGESVPGRWRFDPGRAPAPEELDELRRRAETARARRGAEAEKRHAAARARAARIWQAARLAEDGHPYLAQKGVGAHGLRVCKGALVVPMRNAGGELHNLQFIGASGTKRFLKGGRAAGLCFVIDGTADTICLTEGYATAASIHAATGFTVAVAFSAGNLAAVAVMMRAACRGARIIVCADDDADTPGNPGMTNAREAARAIGALLAVPAFGVDRSADATDFNDLHRARGVGAVRDSISAARPVAGMVGPGNAGAVEAQATDWPEPEPLTEPLESLPYPVEALPSMLREAVTEAQAFVQAPVALVVSAALSALSLAAQGVANVRRDHQLVGPVSLYLLAVADSGERKTCDLQRGAARLGKHPAPGPCRRSRRVRHGCGDSRSEKGRRSRSDQAQAPPRAGHPSEERELEALAKQAPAAPLVPRLLYADATPEALAHALATGWPSGAVLSAEAGAVFGAHGMGQDTILRNLALLNVLWDGGEMAIDRRSKPSFLLRGRRLTFGLMVQPEALRGFLGRAGTLPRGTGFIARFLIAWPRSTQGERSYRPAPESMLHVARYGQRIRELLDHPLATDARGCLTPIVLDLSPPARTAWIRFHDEVERELGATGRFRTVRDVAAKAAELLARLAALFHLLEHGPQRCIDEADVSAAARVVAWHLNEARRLLTELDTPPTLAAAIRLDDWLRNEALASGSDRVPVKRIYQYGPNCVRDSREFSAALAILAERGHARMEEDGRRRAVAINPALLVNRA